MPDKADENSYLSPERRAVFARLTARRARGVDELDVSVLEWTG
jgi:hypothetical protein